MACFTLSRVFVWGVCWTLVVAMVLCPLVGTDTCSIVGMSKRSYLLHGVIGPGGLTPGLLTHLGSAILLGAHLTLFVDPARRFDSSSSTHRLAALFAISTAVECVSILMMPWALHLCITIETTWSSLSKAADLSSISSMAFLVLSCVKRLTLVSGECTNATKARRLMAICSICGAVAILIGDEISLHIFLIRLLFGIIGLSALCGAQWLIFAATKASTEEAMTETGATAWAARLARFTARAAIASTASTVAWCLCVLSLYSPLHSVNPWLREVLYVVDRGTNTLLVFLCAGLIGPKMNPEREFRELGSWIQERRKQQIVETVRTAARATSGPSLMLAAVFESLDPDELLVNAMDRFRCVSWDVLKLHPEIILQGATIDIAGPGGAHLYNLSKPCTFSQCDAFWSHSWRDDADLKWRAMSHWCEDFRQQYGRAPNLWLDKLCIDQSNIRRDLQCLPIFLAACNSLVVCSGRTYTTRLWCCVELFVYARLLAEDSTRRPPVVVPLYSDESEFAAIRQAWRSFDASVCQCVVADDKTRIIGVIDHYPGGVLAFNAFIKDLGGELFEDAPEEQSSAESNVEDDESILYI
eukprot:TRINITY_DN5804_c1_g1_i1.p1 TRINITY_DN5804_c1_g1~~TRINITY_DN5804_c1_g1_i1.p1  ORF type:complete len:585 (-),score=83.56 TRINITY_DN5804_c1_g1_i1:83-1837(-)